VKVSINRTRCQGIGLCEVTAPTVFVVGDDSQAQVLRQPSADDRSEVEEAVTNCPTGALSIESS
jgi:ferredoxin